MGICIVSYVLLGLAFLFRKKFPVPKQILLILLIGNTMACILFGMDLAKRGDAGEVRRNSYGEGDVLKEYTAVVEGESEEVSVEVAVSERQYTEDELQKMFAEVMEKLDTLILGENTSFDRIETDLNLVTEVTGYPVQIQWIMSNYQVLDTDGTIREENVSREGTLVELQGYLSHQETEVIYVRNVMVYPREEESLSLKERIDRLISEKEKEAVTEESFVLPQTIDGKKITWKQDSDSSGYIVWAMALLVAILIIFRQKEQEKDAKKKREEELLCDYPKIIGTFTLLLETGMTVKNAWKKMVQNYEEQKGQTGGLAAYREMSEAYHAMQSGVSQAQAYEQFGNRCGLAQYRKFSTLLSQNLRKGSKGLAELLTMESIQATEEQKSRMKQKAEEAGTKLLIPMFAMLAVVLIMVVVPAFMTIQI